MSRDKQIEEMARLMCANYDGEKGLCGDDMECDHDCWAYREATHLYNAGYRKASEVAREIFEAFKAEIRSEIARNEALFAEDEDDFYDGRNDAFRTAINCLAELKKKYTESEDTE